MTGPAAPSSVSQLATRTATAARRMARRLVDRGRSRTGGSATEQYLRTIPPASPGADGTTPTVVLLNDCRDQHNYGADALVDGLVRILRDRMPAAAIRPVPSHWLFDSRHLDAFVDGGAGLRRPRARYPTVADQFDAVADDWQAGRGGPGVEEILARFDGADLVVLNGEGSIYRRNVSAIRELFLAWFARTRLGIPTAFVNGMVHLTDVEPVLPAMVRRTFPALDAVAVREEPSLRNLHTVLPDRDARVFPDSAFVLTADDARETAAVTEVRQRIGTSRYFCFDPGAMPIDARRGGRSALHHLITTLQQVTPRAVLVCSAPADTYIHAVAEETGALYVDSLLDYREFMALTAHADFLVSGRYHNPILAALVGCPSIGLGSSSHKVHGAFLMLDGMLGTPYDSTYLVPDLGAVRDQARSYVHDRDNWRERLIDVSARRRAEAMGLGDLVAGLASTCR